MVFKATLCGLAAVLLWSTLALLTIWSGGIPPFQLVAMTFAIGACIGLPFLLLRPGTSRTLRQPPKVWLLGVLGLFGYHSTYFAALKLAPATEASLINYLWPLLIVLFSGLLPNEKLRPAHIVGALCGLAGVIVLVSGTGNLGLGSAHLAGYSLALLAAVIWSGYSVLSRLFGAVPTEAVTGFCIVAALLSLICHLAFETTVWPQNLGQWTAVLLLGAGPLGAAFYLWDFGVKRGNIQHIGVISYATPVLSTLLLVAAGAGEATKQLGIACLLIVSGALIATFWRKREA